MKPSRPLKRQRVSKLKLHQLPCTIRSFLTSFTTIDCNENILSRLSLQSSTTTSTITFDTLLFPEQDVMLLDDKPIPTRTKAATLIVAWHKPSNMTIDNSCGQPFRAVLDAIKARFPTQHMHPIGQLDKHTTGLFLFTNCGNTSNYINLPGNVCKTYVVTYIAPAGKEPTKDQITLLCDTGIDVTRPSSRSSSSSTLPTNSVNKRLVRCHSFKLISVTPHGTPYPNTRQKYSYKVELAIDSGANHIVKRVMTQASFPPVKELKRIQIGNIHLEQVEPWCGEESQFVEEKTTAVTLGNFCRVSSDQVNELCSDQDIVDLKCCQLLCKYRSSTDASTKAQQTPALLRLKSFLSDNFRLDGACFGNSQLKCRGGVMHGGVMHQNNF